MICFTKGQANVHGTPSVNPNTVQGKDSKVQGCTSKETNKVKKESKSNENKGE